MMMDDDCSDPVLQPDVYQSVFDEAADPLLIMRGDQFVDGNHASARLLDYPSKQDFLSRDLHPAALSPERQPDGRRSRDKAAEIMALVSVVGFHRFDWTHLDANGCAVPVDVSLTSLAGIADDPSLVAVVWHDRRSASSPVAHTGNARQRLERLATIGQRTTQLVHDINGMMTAVRGCAELLRMNSGLPAGNQDVQGIVTAVDTASSWMRQLLAFVSSDGRVVADEPVDLGEVAVRLGPLLGQVAGPAVTVKVSACSAVVAVSGTDLEQILVNLVANAAEAMPDGGEVKLVVEVDPSVGDVVRLEVRDRGVGMREDQIRRAFEPFHTTKATGTGLGLASVHDIVAAANGAVEVTSAPGQGTAVVVRLPLLGTAS